MSSNSVASSKVSGNGVPSRRRSAGPALLGSELTVLFRRRRTWAMLVAIALIPILLAVAVRLSSETLAPGEGPPFLDRVTQNGLFVAFTAMIVAIPLFLPLTIGVVAGDTIAGEAGQGTLRYLLVAPAGRLRLLLVKYAGVAVFCLAATLTLAVAGTLIGAALFPVGPVTLLSGDVISVPESLLRSGLISLYVTVSLLGFAAIGLFISTLTDVPVGAMAATVVVSVVVQILDVLPQLSWLDPWLFSHYWLGFADLLRQPMDLGSFGDNVLLQLGYIAVFGTLAYGRFSTKDILS
ncbi:ABC transporter permease [Cryobacterium sp. TMT1-62]|uniref:ABC transporter permease n=1 Tax=Cryobacterium sandaracinum TaxID=1259247 RepID=A0ABY2JJA1_9MICO|nr:MULTISPECIES: ABC transporter permease subunit [Cryobacterium]TFB58238.1 ABC transporter permease [Cryobacterium sp. Sr3]TFB58767.1 ABC transporter permease [Cryobacterium sp. Hz7]TFC35165.1 ABC transporter permease [Cryobacterium sp. TMT2-14]TFC51499.1 ABC transporter permease [Cryobacterium sp. TMT2-17-1]TFC71710.1 ABC transporter permease [Cryobacterium sp. TMT2-4]